MFGLMKLRTVGEPFSGTGEEFSRCRLCAALAKNYRSSARIYVNYDVAYFANLIASLRQDETVNATCSCDTGCHCRKIDSDNPVMRWAAATNILLAKLKANDASTDREGWWWRLASRHLDGIMQNQTFINATASWDIPALTALARDQICRESKIAEGHIPFSAPDALNYLAEPTSIITANVVRYGAELVDADAASLVRQTSAGFARIAYFVDAIEDYSADLRHRQFNAVRAAYQLDGKLMPEQVFAEVTDIIRAECHAVSEKLSQLPTSEASRTSLATSFDLNISYKLEWLTKKERYSTADKTPLALRDRLVRAREYFQKIKPQAGKPSIGFVLGMLTAVSAAAIMFARAKYGIDGDALLSGSLDAPVYGVWFAAMGGMNKGYNDNKYRSRNNGDRCVDACCCCSWIAPDCCMYGDDCCPWC